MPGNAFIRFATTGSTKPLQGESMQQGHAGSDGWVEIADWSWEVSSDTSFTKGTGAAVGKPEPGRLTYSHYYDTSSPTLLAYIVKGTHFDTVQIDMLKQVGHEEGTPATFFTLKAKYVFITKVANKGGEDGTVNQEVELTFKEVTVAYKRQMQNGTLDKAQQNFMWSIAQMNDSVSPSIKITL